MGYGMATKDVIIPVRVTRADRDLLKRMAPGGLDSFLPHVVEQFRNQRMPARPPPAT